MATTRQTGNIKKNSFEIAAWQHQMVVSGIDEVGRGCLAGPLVAAAVILPAYKTHRLLKDSKLMTADERNEAFAWIRRHCGYGIGIVHHRIIDQHNIYQATLIAMKKAFMHLLETSSITPSTVLVDAMPLNLSDSYLYDIPIYHFPQGEKKSSSIAAASIVAKVTRDAMMESLHTIIPGYNLAENKGYGTAAHTSAIQNYHYSIIHRVSFLDKLLHKHDEKNTQLLINDILCAHSELVEE